MSFLETLSGAPEPITDDVRQKLDAIQTQLATEQVSQPFAGVALNRLKTVTSRQQLAQEIQGIQDEQEFETMSTALKLELSNLQADVETFTETGARTLQQEVINPANAAIDTLPAWAKLSILGVGVGGTLYGGYKMAGKAWNWVKSAVKKSAGILGGMAVGGLGVLGLGYLLNKKGETPPQTEQPA